MALIITDGQPFTWESATFDWQSHYADNTWDSASLFEYTLSLDESLSLTDSPCKRTACRLQDSLTASDRLTRTSKACLEEALTCTSNAAHQARIERTHSTALRLTAQSSNHASLTTCDTIAPQERTTSHPLSKHTAPINVQPQITNCTDYRRTICQNTTFTATSARKLNRPSRETLTLHDDRLTPYAGILSDITLTHEAMDDTLWQTCATSPGGYGAFHPFEVGEYTYRDALVRLILTIGAAGTHPLLYDVALHVDIDDVREHGLADCTANDKTRIILTRSYYHPPRIVLTTVQANLTGTMPIPHLIEQGTQDGQHYFDCELRTADGIRSAGTISYLAEGY